MASLSRCILLVKSPSTITINVEIDELETMNASLHPPSDTSKPWHDLQSHSVYVWNPRGVWELSEGLTAKLRSEK